MSPELVSAIAAVLLSVGFEYIPGLSKWYNALPDTSQRLIMLGCLCITVAGAFGLSCAGWLSVFQCTNAGIRDAVFALILAVAANQGVYNILPKAKK